MFVRMRFSQSSNRITRALLVVLLGCFAVVAFGQNKDLEKANELYQSARYAEAAQLYEKVLDSYSDKRRSTRSSLNVMTKLARCYSMNNRHHDAEKLYSEIVKDERANPEAFLYLGETLMVNGKYDQAKASFVKYKELKPEDETVDLLIRSCEVAPTIAPVFEQAGVRPFPYNSEADDNSPIIWNGGILFSSDRNSGLRLLKEKSGWTGRDFLDLYFSAPSGDGTFAPPVQFSGKLSVLNKNLCNASITKDGTTIYFTRNDSEPNRREIYNLQLYTARAVGDKWKDVEKLPFCSPGSNYMHPAISPDGNTLYFTSDKPRGKGGTDLWVVRKKGDAWGRPENLGETINTALNEGFPFVAADGSLYFCSKGHPGFGGFDIFKTKQRPDGSWEEPVNLGRPINSSFDDISIFLNADGVSGLFTSSREGGDDDIYFFSPDIPKETVAMDTPAETEQHFEEEMADFDEQAELPMEKQEEIVQEIKAAPIAETPPIEPETEPVPGDLPKEEKQEEVPPRPRTEQATKEAAPKQPEFEAPKSEKRIEQVENNETQSQLAEHPAVVVQENVVQPAPPAADPAKAEKVKEKARESDSLAAMEMMPAPTAKEAPEHGLLSFEDLSRKLNLDALKVGDRFRLEGARYDVNVWQPTPQVARALDALAELMKQHPTFVIELGAHTESIGMDAYNLELSRKRAEMAREYLLREGITPDRVVAKGYGETQLLNHCANGVDCTLMEHLINQRLEVKILKR